MRATRTFLDMREAASVRPAPSPRADARIERLAPSRSAIYRDLYLEVGRAWRWVDRSTWSDDDARRHLERPDVSVWLATVDQARAGYFELQRHPDGSVEIAYFGLRPDFIGQRIGAWLLTEAVRAAWSLGPTRVWLHTSTLDHPAALHNYLARGFRVVRTEDYEVPDA